MTTKDVNKLDILDKVKEILNKKMKSKRTSEVYIVDFASSLYRNI